MAYNNTVPDYFFEEFITQSKKVGVKVQVNKWEPTVLAAME